MKHLFFSVGLLLLSSAANQTFSQNWGGQNPVKSIIKPSESRGYIYWSPVPNANYVVSIYEKQGDGTFTLLITKSTDNNFARLSNYLSNPNAFYSVSAYNSETGSLIVSDSPQPINGLPPETICVEKCNGANYAYAFSFLEGGPTGGTYLTINETYNTVDNVNGIIVPYWQAVSTVQYDQMPNSHPYKRLTANGPGPAIYERKHAQIINGGAMFNGQTIGGPFYDAQNNVVTSGWLIEKRLNGYTHFGTSRTTAQPTTDLCTATTNFWVNFYNNGNPYGLQQVSTDQIYFTGGSVPSEIVCIQSFSGFGDGDDDCCDGFEQMNSFLDCTSLATWNPDQGQGSEAWFDCWDELDTGDPVVGVTIGPLDESQNITLVATFDPSGNINVIEKKGEINEGLHRITLYTSRGLIIPTIFEHKSALLQDKDRVKLVLTPNPIVNNELKFKVSSEKTQSVRIEVKTLNGETLYDETTTLSDESDLYRTIPITSNSPYNQLRVNLLFQDGSSIQKTALH